MNIQFDKIGTKNFFEWLASKILEITLPALKEAIEETLSDEEMLTRKEVSERIFKCDVTTFDSNYRYKKIQRDLDVYEAWKNAVNRMNAYRNYYGNDSYEALINGIPANFFSDFVQIGDTVIPFNANRSFFNSLTSERKTTILSVSITIIEIFVIE